MTLDQMRAWLAEADPDVESNAVLRVFDICCAKTVNRIDLADIAAALQPTDEGALAIAVGVYMAMAALDLMMDRAEDRASKPPA